MPFPFRPTHSISTQAAAGRRTTLELTNTVRRYPRKASFVRCNRWSRVTDLALSNLKPACSNPRLKSKQSNSFTVRSVLRSPCASTLIRHGQSIHRFASDENLRRNLAEGVTLKIPLQVWKIWQRCAADSWLKASPHR